MFRTKEEKQAYKAGIRKGRRLCSDPDRELVFTSKSYKGREKLSLFEKMRKKMKMIDYCDSSSKKYCSAMYYDSSDDHIYTATYLRRTDSKGNDHPVLLKVKERLNDENDFSNLVYGTEKSKEDKVRHENEYFVRGPLFEGLESRKKGQARRKKIKPIQLKEEKKK